MPRVRYLNQLTRVEGLSREEIERLQPVSNWFAFKATDYYLSLIDWDDPNDPIKRVVIPNLEELDEWGRPDPSKEHSYTIFPGLQHKYKSTALLLASGECAGYCRYCFRKRIFTDDAMEVLRDLPRAVEYIREHEEITNVLLTGGDPMVLSTRRLRELLSALRSIRHVRIIRIGTRMLSYNPFRVLEDPELLEVIEQHSLPDKRIYVITHFNHPREITPPALRAVRRLQKAGAIVANQTPMIKGVNDSARTLAELFRKLSFAGVPPYYVFQIRPAVGNKPFAVPVEQGYVIFERAKARVSGLAKRARFVMSHSTGKIEVVGLTDEYIFFKYHRAARYEDSGRFMAFRRNPRAYWFDDYKIRLHDSPVVRPDRLARSEAEHEFA